MENKYKAYYTQSYLQDFKECVNYFRNVLKSSKAIKSFIDAEKKGTRNILTMPYAYKVLKNKYVPFEIRSIDTKNYKILYSIENNTIKFWHILYAKRNFNKKYVFDK